MHTQFSGDNREFVKMASLGCQVWLKVNDYKRAFELVHATKKWKSKKRKATFSYWLSLKEENPFYDELKYFL